MQKECLALARINLYLPDDLKARMDAVGDDGPNWSEVARPAIALAVATEEQRRTGDMNSAIERLRASKEKLAGDDFAEGTTEGRNWAAQEAEFDELQRVSQLLGYNFEITRGAKTSLVHAIDPESELSPNDVIENLFGEDQQHRVTDARAAGFIVGATEFFAEVEDQL